MGSVRVGAVLDNGSKPAPVSALCQIQNLKEHNVLCVGTQFIVL